MRRIKLEVFKGLFEKNLTGNELDFILALSHLQNDAGKICGMHYREMMKKTGMSAQAFYDCKKSLEEKKVIQVAKGDRDYDITLCHNDFSTYTSEDYQKGEVPAYLNTDKNMFFDSNWKRLKPMQKLLAMDLLNINMAGGRAYKSRRKHFFEKYADSWGADGVKKKGLLGVNPRTLQKYLKLLQLYFSIGLKDGIYYITLRSTFSKTSQKQTGHESTFEYLFETGCRRNHIKTMDGKEKQDILKVFYIYRKTLSGANFFLKIPTLFRRMIEILNEGILNERKWERRLKASLLHKLLKEELQIA